MHIKKTSLVAAALLLAANSIFAEQIDSLEGSSDKTVTGILIIDQELNSTMRGRLLDAGTGVHGTVIKNGSGVLEYQGWAVALNVDPAIVDPNNLHFEGFFKGHQYLWSGYEPIYMNDPRYSDPKDKVKGAFQGNFIVNEGTLQISGYLNQWAATPSPVDSSYTGMNGVSGIVLNNSGRLTFQNTALNIVDDDVTQNIGSGRTQGGPFAPLKTRFQIVNNLTAGGYDEKGNLVSEQLHTAASTELEIGLNSSSRVMVYIDPAANNNTGGSIGIISGSGRFIKAGQGNFRILGDAVFRKAEDEAATNDVILGGGVTYLQSSTGKALATADSVNLVGSSGTVGAGVVGGSTITGSHYVMGYAPPAENSRGGGLQLVYDQTINNLQARWYERATFVGSNDETAGMYNAEPLMAGTGGGTHINLTDKDLVQQAVDPAANGRTLTVNQTAGNDGYYQGTIYGNKDSVFVKNGDGTLAIFIKKGDGFKGTFQVNEGRLLTDVNSMGFGKVVIGDIGIVEIVQTYAGTLSALIEGQGDVALSFGTYGYIYNSDNKLSATKDGNTLIGDKDLEGVIEVARQQPGYQGSVIINEGMKLILSYSEAGIGIHNTFANAASMQLESGTTGRETTLAFADTNQRINNLIAGAGTRIDLGRGTMVLNQTSPDTGVIYSKITGIGNFVKTGSQAVTPAGTNAYFGSTVVKESDIILTTADCIKDTSAVILYSGTRIVNAGDFDQHFGALFGETKSTVVMGTGKLTIGIDDSYRSALALTLNAFDAAYQTEYQTALSAGKTPAEARASVIAKNEAVWIQTALYFDTITAGEKGALPWPVDFANFNLSLSDFTQGTSKYYLSDALKELLGVGLNNADALAFAGAIEGSGALVKIGNQRLTFTGQSPSFTGKIEVKQGYFRMNSNSLDSASGILISTAFGSDTDMLEVNVANKSAGLTLVIPTSGDGTFKKIGSGQLSLEADKTKSRGDYIVEDGRLVTKTLNVLAPNSKVSLQDSGVFVFDTQLSSDPIIKNVSAATTIQGIEKMPTGSTIMPDGKIRLPAGATLASATTIRLPDGSQMSIPVNNAGVETTDPKKTGGVSYVEITPVGYVFKYLQNSQDSGSYALLPDGAQLITGATINAAGDIVLPDSKINPYTGAYVAKDAGASVIYKINENGELVVEAQADTSAVITTSSVTLSSNIATKGEMRLNDYLLSEKLVLRDNGTINVIGAADIYEGKVSGSGGIEKLNTGTLVFTGVKEQGNTNRKLEYGRYYEELKHGSVNDPGVEITDIKNVYRLPITVTYIKTSTTTFAAGTILFPLDTTIDEVQNANYSDNLKDIKMIDGRVVATPAGYITTDDAGKNITVYSDKALAYEGAVRPNGTIVTADSRVAPSGVVIEKADGLVIYTSAGVATSFNVIQTETNIYLDGTGAEAVPMKDHDNTLIVSKDGKYTVTTNGSTTVLGGTLTLGSTGTDGLAFLPAWTTTGSDDYNAGTYYSDFEVAAGATLVINLVNKDTIGVDADGVTHGILSGSGTFVKAGASTLEVGAGQQFSGNFVIQKVAGGSQNIVSLQADNALGGSRITIEDNGVIVLNGYDQEFTGLSGGANTAFYMGDINPTPPYSNSPYGNITFVVPSGVAEAPFEGKIYGGGDIIKNGGGTLSLRGNNTGTFDGNVIINEGTLEVTVEAIGSARSVLINSAGTLQFYVGLDKKGKPITDEYKTALRGTAPGVAGTVGKSGGGILKLTYDDDPVTGSQDDNAIKFAVSEGTIEYDIRRTVDRTIPVIPPSVELPAKVTVAKDATFQVDLPEPTQTVGYSNQVTGAGNFAISGANTVKFRGSKPDVGYSGLTILKNGVIADFTEKSGLIGGLRADADTLIDKGTNTTVLLATPDFTLTQTQDADFYGTFMGTGATNLIISHEKSDSDAGLDNGIFKFYGSDLTGNLAGAPAFSGNATVSVKGGKLQVGVANQKEITVGTSSDGTIAGTLYISDSTGTEENPGKYTTGILGVGNIVKTGSGTLDANASTGTSDVNGGFFKNPGFTLQTLGVIEGNLNLNFDGLNFAQLPFKALQSNGTGTLQITGAALPENIISGTGTVSKVGYGTMTYVSQTGFTGTLMVSEGTLKGNFTHSGDLINEATLAPGNSIGAIKVGGDFVQSENGVLKIEFAGSDNYDKVYYAQTNADATATVLGKMEISGNASRGAYAIIRRADYGDITAGLDASGLYDEDRNAWNITFVDDSSMSARWISDKESQWIDISPTEKVLSPYYAYRGQFLLSQSSLNNVPGYTPHDGVGGFIGVLDSFAGTTTPGSTRQSQAQYIIGGYLNSTISAGDLTRVVNNFSPLGYGSLVGMPAAAANAATEQLHARLEQRRYDMATFTTNKWEIYAIGTSNFASNSDGTSDATFDFNTYGGIVGADYQINETNLVGGAVEYTNGKADIHDGGGKVKMNEVRFTGYLTHMLSNWFYVDAGLSGGYMSYDAKRQTSTGENKASPDGWTMGTFATIGTVFPVIDKSVYLNPYAGIEYNHYDVSGFTESGSVSRLKVDGYGYDSLRAKIGTGLSWLIPSGDWSWKVNVDAAYAHECLDTESKLKANFVEAGGSRFSVDSKTLASDVFQIGPSLTLNFTDDTSIFASYRLEIGFDGEMYNNINIGFRTRF